MGRRGRRLQKGHRTRLDLDESDDYDEEVTSPRPKKQRTTNKRHRQGNNQLLDELEEEEQASDAIGRGETSGDRSVFATLTDPEVLDCPICFEHLSLPVFQCPNGHLACSSCCSKLGNKCPSCSSLVGFSRCRGVEQILESVKIPCRNMKYGCKELVFKCKRHDHEENCTFAQGKRAGKEVVEQEDDPVEDKRSKVTARKESKARSLWKEKVLKKGVCCERQVDRHSLGDTEYIMTIANRGLSHFFQAIDGYYKPWVIEFYQNMYIDTAKREIEAYVENEVVQITPDLIARYLGYTRPPSGSTTYPDSKRVSNTDEINETVYNNYHGKSAIGLMKDDYRTMNKIIHHNLYPRGNTSMPGEKELELLYVFMKHDEVVDWADWIFDQMIDFKISGSANLKMPFVVMVTEFCKLAGVKQPAGFKLEPPNPGPFNNASEMRSKALSKPPPLPHQAQAQPQQEAKSSAPMAAPPKKLPGLEAHVIGMLESILCRQEDIMKEQKILNTKVDYVIARFEDRTKIQYDPNLNTEPLSGGIGENESDDDDD